MRCEFVVRGDADTRLVDAFPGFEVSSDGTFTTLTGWVVDDAAFAGALERFRSAGVELVTARRDGDPN